MGLRLQNKRVDHAHLEQPVPRIYYLQGSDLACVIRQYTQMHLKDYHSGGGRYIINRFATGRSALHPTHQDSLVFQCIQNIYVIKRLLYPQMLSSSGFGAGFAGRRILSSSTSLSKMLVIMPGRDRCSATGTYKMRSALGGIRPPPTPLLP